MNLAELLKETGIVDDDGFSFMDEEPAPPPPPPATPQVQIQMDQQIPAAETKENNVRVYFQSLKESLLTICLL